MPIIKPYPGLVGKAGFGILGIWELYWKALQASGSTL